MVMKRIASLFLALVMVLCLCPTALAAGHETLVSYEGQGTSEYLLTVPARLAPGGSGTVNLEGTWPSNETIKVTADSSVTLTNSIDSSTKVLDISFDGISQSGDNEESVSVSEGISVDSIEDALFGVWSGEFFYNLSVEDSDEITESPIYFGEVYGGGFANDESEIYLLGMLNEDGSMGMMYLENGVMVGEGSVEAGSLSYSGLNIIEELSGDVIATVSPDGKSIDFVEIYDGVELTLQETGVQYGESYWTSIEENGSTEYGILTFYEDGSTELLSIDTDGVETELLGEPTGSYRYDGVLIYGEDELVGFAFDNGTKLFTGGLVFVLGEPDIDIGSTYSSTFADNSWEDIIAACEADEVPSTWSVGDTKAMTIDGTEYNIQIIGKNHDTYSDGSGTAPLTFQLVELYGTKYRMNSSNDNTTGWSGSAMRSTTLPTILANMPSEVQSAIKSVNKSTLKGSGVKGTNPLEELEVTSDKLFLLSEMEVFGTTSYSNGYSEGSQYAFYTNGGSKIKTFEGSSTNWWLRGPRYDTIYNFSFVNGVGYLNTSTASNYYGVSFGFCF